jgi:glycosyltransferase involved in cell wall biosynthesis
VVFCPANGALLQPYTETLERSGVTVLADWERRTEFLRTAGAELRLALLSRPNVAWQLLEQVRDWAPNAVVVYDTVDLHYVRLAKEADLATRQGEPERAASLRRRADASRELELALVRSCDVTLTVSSAERDVLTGQVPGADVEVLSIVHDEATPVTSPAGRTEVLFVGGFNHLPNRDAVQWLCTEIMPLVRTRCPDAVLHVVGSNIPEELKAFAGDGVVMHGWVPDLAARYRSARLSIAPLRFGAGVKGKVAESLAYGVPVVGTSIAFEGMDLRPDEHVLLGETEQELADQIATLLTKDELWQQLATASQRAMIAQLGPDVARAELASLLARTEN